MVSRGAGVGAVAEAMLQPVIDRQRARAGDGQPQEQRQVLEFIEPEQRLERIHFGPFRRADRDDHGDGGPPAEMRVSRPSSRNSPPKNSTPDTNGASRR